MLNIKRISKYCGLIILALCATSPAWADSLTLITSVAAQSANDTVKWSQLGADGTVLAASVGLNSTGGASVTASLAGANSIASVVCTATPCSWTGSGFTAGDTLLWTSDAGNGGNGPVTLTFATSVSGAGALIQADGPGQFTAKIQAFNGGTSLGSFTVLSNNVGDATYMGVKDQTGANITSIVISQTSCVGTCTDFALDTLNLNTVTGAPTVTLSATSLNFGNQQVGTTSAAKAVTLTNSGTASLSITSIVASGDYAATNTCGSSVIAGANCSISVTFKPTIAGTRTGSVTITDSAANSPQSISLTGVGTSGGGPAVTLSATSLNFGNQAVGTTSAGKSVTLTNSGTATLSLTSIVASGDYSATNNCGSSLNAGAKCSISTKFKPTTTGTRTGSVTITDNASNSPQSISLTGVGTSSGSPAVTLSATSLTFATQLLNTTSAAQSVTLTNSGSATLNITSIAASGNYLATNTCGSSVIAGGHCSISVMFDPTAIGTLTGSVTITDNASNSPQLISLTGTGTEVKLSGTSLTFPATTVGKLSAPQSVTLTNVGSTSMKITSITLTGANASDFTKSNTCGASVNAGASCTLTFKFKPTAKGTRTASGSIADAGGGSPQTIALTGTGQ